MPDERDTLWERLTELQSCVRLLETKVDNRLDALAPREWVHQIMQPIQQSLARMESNLSQVMDDAKGLLDMHSAMLREKGERERAEWAERTPRGLVRKWGPVVFFVGGIVALFRVLGTLIEAWIMTIR